MPSNGPSEEHMFKNGFIHIQLKEQLNTLVLMSKINKCKQFTFPSMPLQTANWFMFQTGHLQHGLH